MKCNKGRKGEMNVLIEIRRVRVRGRDGMERHRRKEGERKGERKGSRVKRGETKKT